jgi:Gnt-I system high-affinity gluconate transporter
MSMNILITLAGILTLVFLIAYARVYTFLAFFIVILLLGLCLGMQPSKLLQSVQNGIGGTLGSLVPIIALGAILGKMIAISGAAQQISLKMIDWVGEKQVRWAFMITGFIVGLPLFYSVGFLLLVPIAITVAYRRKLPAVYVGLPLLASLSVTQGYLPPHPAPLFLVKQLHADMGLTLGYGILISIPAILISGALYGSTLKRYDTLPNTAFVAPELNPADLPPVSWCFFTVLLPIVLMGAGTVCSSFFITNSIAHHILVFISDPSVSLLITVLLSFFTLGIARRMKREAVNGAMTDAVKDVASILLIFGVAGGLKQVLTDSGVSDDIAKQLQHLHMNPYVLGWSIAAVIRVMVGSSTVSGITTAGFIAPLLLNGAVADPNLMVLSIGAGSMMFSHVNDTGFWLFREYFQLSFKHTIATWSVMDTLVSVTGLLGVLLLSVFIH